VKRPTHAPTHPAVEKAPPARRLRRNFAGALRHSTKTSRPWTVDAWAPLDGRFINGGIPFAF